MGIAPSNEREVSPPPPPAPLSSPDKSRLHAKNGARTVDWVASRTLRCMGVVGGGDVWLWGSVSGSEGV